jgi:sarcosine oxidase, subunit beta
MPDLPKSARIIIIGGGVMGLFTAWELGRRGETDVVILERRSFLGAGATQKAAGGVRAQFTTAPNVALSLYSQDFYRRRFAPEIFPDFEYRQNGYLFFARSAEKLAALDRSLKLQREHGVYAARRLAPKDLLDILPDLYIDDILGANYSPEDGFVDPGDIVYGLDTEVRRMGIRIFLDTEAMRIESDGDYKQKVVAREAISRNNDNPPAGTSADHEIRAEKILIAAGAWSEPFGKACGYDLPIVPYRRNIYVTGPLSWFPATAPFTYDIVTGTHFRPESSGILFLKINPDEGPSYNEEPDLDWLPSIIPDLTHVMPRLEEAQVTDAWAGLYDMSPDHSAILGPLPGAKGVYFSAGFSGHGLMHAPAVGISMAEYLLNGKTSTIDVSDFSLDRFKSGKLIEEAAVF